MTALSHNRKIVDVRGGRAIDEDVVGDGATARVALWNREPKKGTKQ
jgi:hypothetical protein